MRDLVERLARRLRPTRGRMVRLGLWLACALAAAVVVVPLAAERAVEQVRFDDDLGTFPVEVGLAHNGTSVLDTGVLGKVYWRRTGPFGFGAYARAEGPPEAGGTLASYVDDRFIRANVSLIDDPDRVVVAYAAELSSGLREHVLRDELMGALIGGTVLYLLVPWRRLRGLPRARVVASSVALVLVATTGSMAYAVHLFHEWPLSRDPGTVYSLPGEERIGFGSQETREVAAQVQPFLEKNTDRIKARAASYEDTASETFARSLAAHAADLRPRKGESVVLAEADPQGSYVGVRVRKDLYAQLADALGAGAITLRTAAGDIASNGTVAESAYVEAEAKVAPDVPYAAVGGDHDGTVTWRQLTADGVHVPDRTSEEVAGIRVSGANDREHKTLFGGSVTDPTGTTEQELGAGLREVVDDDADAKGPDVGRIVLLHQPDAVAAYLDLADLTAVRDVEGSATTPYDDALPDLPPGIVDIGHLHQLDGPWVLWNTDGPRITWTVVDQLGTAGGVENSPTFSRFSTPVSVPLKTLAVRLQYLNPATGLQTGYATLRCDLDGVCSVTDRVDVGLPGGRPVRNPDPTGDGSTPAPAPSGTVAGAGAGSARVGQGR